MGRDGTSKFIICPMALPDISEKEKGYLYQAIVDNEIGVGSYIGRFEEAWASYNGYKFSAACNSGTSALYLAVKASGATKIAVPNFTMVATAWAATGLDITYIPTRKELPLAEYDFDYSSYHAIIFAHIYGRKAYPDGWVKKIKQKNPKLVVIDDMAEAHGVSPEGDIACYSFYANKIITTGEGGMCLTNNKELANEMRSLANMYFDKERSMIHPKIGHNFRMTNLQAAIGTAQVERMPEILLKRDRVERWYAKYLPKEVQLPRRNVLWLYDIRVENAKKVMDFLRFQGSESRRFFYPMSLQPWGDQMQDENALDWYKHGLLLPTYNSLQESDIKWIAETLELALKRAD